MNVANEFPLFFLSFLGGGKIPDGIWNGGGQKEATFRMCMLFMRHLVGLLETQLDMQIYSYPGPMTKWISLIRHGLIWHRRIGQVVSNPGAQTALCCK